MSGGLIGFFLLLVLLTLIIVVIYIVQDDSTPSSSEIVWIAAGKTSPAGSGNILYSTDGESWTESSGQGSSFNGTGGRANYAAYGKDKWVAVGQGSAVGGPPSILWSNDGICWAEVDSSGASFSYEGHYVDYGKDLWVAVGNDLSSINPGTSQGNILWSNDGTCWAISSGTSFSKNGERVGYFGDVDLVVADWVAGGDDSGSGSCYGNLKWSEDGKTWFDSFATGEYFENYATGLANNGSYFLASGDDTRSNYHKFLFSIAGRKWSREATSGASFTGEVTDVAWGKDKFVAVGYQYPPGESNILYSENGFSWHYGKGLSFAGGIPNGGYGVEYGGGKWIAVGQNEGSSYRNILTSPDGITWSQSSSTGPSFIVGNGIGYKY